MRSQDKSFLRSESHPCVREPVGAGVFHCLLKPTAEDAFIAGK